MSHNDTMDTGASERSRLVDPGRRTTVSTDELRPHPKNDELYDDRNNQQLAERIERNGFDEHQRLLICPDGTILSGHRRWGVAKAIGMDTVPVEVADVEPDSDDALEKLLTANDYREKTPAEIVREGEVWEDIEEDKAGERKEATQIQDGTAPDRQNFAQPVKGRARDKAAEKVGVSGETLRKGKTVKEKAEKGDPDAQEQWEQLERGQQSIHGAYEAVTDPADDSSAGEDASGSSSIEPFTSQQTDEWSSPRELVEPLSDAIDGFDLDPCSGAEQSPFADSTVTETDDGLAVDWFGDVWVNPPYSDVAEWTKKAIHEAHRDPVESICYLCKGDSSTDWWQQTSEAARFVATIDHRLAFGDGENSAPFASHVFVFGTDTDRLDALTDALEGHGTILVPVSEIERWNDER